jgi:hypothetical protein
MRFLLRIVSPPSCVVLEYVREEQDTSGQGESLAGRKHNNGRGEPRVPQVTPPMGLRCETGVGDVWRHVGHTLILAAARWPSQLNPIGAAPLSLVRQTLCDGDSGRNGEPH